MGLSLRRRCDWRRQIAGVKRQRPECDGDSNNNNSNNNISSNNIQQSRENSGLMSSIGDRDVTMASVIDYFTNRKAPGILETLRGTNNSNNSNSSDIWGGIVYALAEDVCAYIVVVSLGSKGSISSDSPLTSKVPCRLSVKKVARMLHTK
eukprot:Tbor_TRINITY_DN5657_c5_g1::TRINITY_DN5657_c5_g1_i1::g.9450::m.9450